LVFNPSSLSAFGFLLCFFVMLFILFSFLGTLRSVFFLSQTCSDPFLLPPLNFFPFHSYSLPIGWHFDSIKCVEVYLPLILRMGEIGWLPAFVKSNLSSDLSWLTIDNTKMCLQIRSHLKYVSQERTYFWFTRSIFRCLSLSFAEMLLAS